MNEVEVLVTLHDAGMRLDAFVSRECELSRSLVQQLILEKNVLVNGVPSVKSYKLLPEDTIAVTVPIPSTLELIPQNIPLDICYEDEWLLVVNKAKGMVVHPAAGNADGTLVNALLYHCNGKLSHIEDETRPGIVHRIDKDTSGLLVVAKDDATHDDLAAQFAEHSITRVYHAVVYGGFKDEEGVIDAPIGRSVKDRKKMAVTANRGRNAVTHYHVLERFDGFSYLGLQLETGRTHQIRVHMAEIGRPVVGDLVYGPKKKTVTSLQGQCLHAKKLGFVHPATGAYVEFDSELPEYFTTFLSKLRGKYGI